MAARAEPSLSRQEKRERVTEARRKNDGWDEVCETETRRKEGVDERTQEKERQAGGQAKPSPASGWCVVSATTRETSGSPFSTSLKHAIN